MQKAWPKINGRHKTIMEFWSRTGFADATAVGLWLWQVFAHAMPSSSISTLFGQLCSIWQNFQCSSIIVAIDCADSHNQTLCQLNVNKGIIILWIDSIFALFAYVQCFKWWRILYKVNMILCLNITCECKLVWCCRCGW